MGLLPYASRILSLVLAPELIQSSMSGGICGGGRAEREGSGHTFHEDDLKEGFLKWGL